MSKATDDLTHEHSAILFALKILEGMNRAMAASNRIEVGDVTDFLGFLGEFADKCHHGKEEGFLFPALIQTDFPERQELIDALLADHVKGRSWIREMNAALLPELKADEFRAASIGYTALLQSHIEKENDVLFPLAERLLSDKQLEALYEAFENHEANVVGAGRHEQLHALLKRLMAKYSPRGSLGANQRDEV